LIHRILFDSWFKDLYQNDKSAAFAALGKILFC
jgi:hypothetical protein